MSHLFPQLSEGPQRTKYITLHSRIISDDISQGALRELLIIKERLPFLPFERLQKLREEEEKTSTQSRNICQERNQFYQ